jgi:hypothetical protein
LLPACGGNWVNETGICQATAGQLIKFAQLTRNLKGSGLEEGGERAPAGACGEADYNGGESGSGVPELYRGSVNR